MTKKSLHEKWLEEPENRAVYEEEGLVHDASDLLFNLMEREELSQAEVANLLDCSEANVSQLLGGGRNLTLRTLARFAWVLGYRIRFRARRVRSQLKSEQLESSRWMPVEYCGGKVRDELRGRSSGSTDTPNAFVA